MIDNEGQIITRGADSHAIFAQSIGGGGGTGGNGAHGVPDDFEVSDVVPLPGIIDEQLQSEVDKLGDRDKLEFSEKLDIVVGGSGGFGNDADDVTVTQSGDISTLNNGSYGILAQSIGAGGGVGGSGAIGKDGKLGIGGGGGAAGHGANVDVLVDGNIDTLGVASHGIFAQSIGGGGGIAGNLDFGIVDVQEDILDETFLANVPVKLDSKINNLGIGVAWGRDGGSAGHGGNINISSEGQITTRGDAAYGIFAQSVGGGGGLAGNNGFGLTGEILNKASCFFECNALTGSAGGDGSGGEIHIDHGGDITTFGDVAHGIFAQSAGGKTEQGEVTQHTKMVEDSQLTDSEGNKIFDPDSLLPFPVPLGDLGLDDVVSDFAGQRRDDYQGFISKYLQASTSESDYLDFGKDVSITVTGNVTVHGNDSHGIFAQSIGGDGNGDITIAVTGAVQGGGGSGAGVRFKDGANNTLEIRGSVSSVNGLSGAAILGGVGNETVNNFGKVTGIVILGEGTNAFVNHPGSTFDSGTVVNLGGGTISNAGEMSPGGRENILTSNVDGNLVQESTGVLEVDTNLQTDEVDVVAVSGTADLDGKVVVNSLSPEAATSGMRSVTILDATLGVTDSGLGLEQPESAIVDYELIFANVNELKLGIDVDFVPDYLNANQSAIGRYIAGLRRLESSDDLNEVIGTLIEIPDEQGLKAAYNQLIPEIVANTKMTTLYSSMFFSDALLSCAARGGDFRFIAEGQCGWMRLAVRKTQSDETSQNEGFDDKVWQLAGGAQFRLGEKWLVGGALSYEDRTVDLVSGSSASDGYQAQAGVVGKRQFGRSLFSASLAGGYSELDTQRTVITGATAYSDQDIWSASSHLRGEWVFENGDAFLKPRVDLGVDYSSMDGYQEQGAGGANLQVDKTDDTHVYAQVGLDWGGEAALGGGTLLRPILTAGFTRFLNDASPSVTATFLGAPPGLGSFTVTSDLDRSYFDVGLGVDILTDRALVFQLNAFHRFSEHTSGTGGSLKFAIPF
jgi:uncharacterized protein YhjY with autotransporter beta-barrel domain